VNITRKVTKQDLKLLSDLIFNSYVEQNIELVEHHFIIRSLTTKERDEIFRKYQYLPSKFNIKLILEILTYSILYIDGHIFDRNKYGYFVHKFNSKLILKLYSEFQSLELSIADASRFVDYYIETKESRNMWAVFKICSRLQEPFSIRNFNQYQFYWIVMNVFKDSLDDEKKSWSRTEYMTNSICAFLNPKAFRKVKSQIGVVEHLEQYEDKSKKRIVEELEEDNVKKVVESNDVFSSLERLQEETDEEYEYRVNTLLEKTLKGELVDEHDRLVRKSEIDFLKKFLREKRIQVLVEREIRYKQGYKFDNVEALENEALKIQLEEDKRLGFYHDDFSYIDIVNMKDFVAVSNEEKQIIFDEVMSEDVDENVKTEVNRFLKDLSSDKIKDDDREGLSKDKLNPIDNKIENVSEGESDSSSEENNIIKTFADKAANMSIDIKGIDLLKQKQDKINNAIKVMNMRNNTIKTNSDSNLDVIKFE